MPYILVMRTWKTVSIFLLGLLAVSTGTAQNIQVDSLENKQVDVSYEASTQTLVFHNEYMEQRIKPEQFYTPNQLEQVFQDSSFKFKMKNIQSSEFTAEMSLQAENYTSDAYLGKTSEIKRVLGASPYTATELPQNKFNYSKEFTTDISNRTDSILTNNLKDSDKNISLDIQLATHYEHLLVYYSIIHTNSTGDQNVVWTDRDIYSGKEPEKIPFQGEVISSNDNQVTQRIRYDNRYDQRQSEIVHIMHHEEGEIRSTDFGGLPHEKLPDYSYSRDAVPELQNAGINPSLIRDSSNDYRYTAYNVTFPEDSFKPLEITVSGKENISTEQDGDLIVHDTNTFYTYIIGSGGAVKISNGKDLCGTHNYDTVLIDATIDICPGDFSRSLTLSAEDRIEITENGYISGEGQDGTDESFGDDDGGNADDGASLSLSAEDIIINGGINIRGGDGGDGGSSFSAGDGGDGGNGGQPGSLDILAGNRLFINESIQASGGDGGSGGDAGDEAGDTGGDGGFGGDAQSVDIDAAFVKISSNGGIEAYSGEGGDGGGSGGGAGGGGGSAGDIFSSFNINTVNATLKGSIDRYGGDGGNEEEGGFDGPGQGGDVQEPVEIKTRNAETTGLFISTDGGSAGSYAPFEDEGSLSGADAGNIIWEVKGGSINDVQFSQQGGNGAGDGDDGEGGDNTIRYKDNDFTVFNNIYELGGNPSGTQSVTQDTSLTFDSNTVSDFETLNLTVYNQELGKNESYRVNSGYNITAEWKFQVNNTNDVISNAYINLYREDRVEEVDKAIMTEVSTSQGTDTRNYTYRFNYTVPQQEEYAGTWNVTAEAEDLNGNNYTTTIYDFIYQYLGRTDGSPNQGDAVFGQSIPFEQNTRRTNPSQTQYKDVPLQFQFIEGTLMNSIAVINENNNEVSYSTNDTSRTVFWEKDNFAANSTYRYDLEYEIEQIIVSEQTSVEEVGDREVGVQELSVNNPTTVQLEDIEARREFYDPGRTVDWSLFFNGDEITNADGYNALAQDFDNDGIDEQLTWQIDTLDVGVEQDYTIRTDLGIPIEVYNEPVITNKPVEEGKPVRWREGYAFYNPNDYQVPYTFRMPLPVDATNIRLGGVLTDTSFGSTGAFVPFEETLPIQENVTAFLKYQTRSISTTVDTNRPSNHTVDEPSRVVKNVDIENLAGNDLSNISQTLNVRYGTELNVTDVETGEVVENQSVVQDDYTVNLDKVEAADTRELRVEYYIPTPSSEVVREGSSSSGNTLKVWRVTNENIEPLQNVFFETGEIDCTEVREIRVLSRTNQSLTNVTDYRCGSTIVPLGELEGSEVVRLAIEYDKIQEDIQGNPIIPPLLGFLKWFVPLTGLRAAVYLVARNQGVFNDG